MAITHRIDDENRRLWVAADGSTTGAHIVDFTLALTAERAELRDYDFVFDLRKAGGDATNNDVDRVATSFAATPSVPTYTVFITHDPSFSVWARAMDFQFPDRKHYVVGRPDAAESLLQRLRAEVTPVRAS